MTQQGVFGHHALMYEVAQESHALYEKLAKNNKWRKQNPDENAWVAACGPSLTQYVIKKWVESLNRNDLSPEEKERRFNIYMADTAMPLAKERGALLLPGDQGFY